MPQYGRPSQDLSGATEGEDYAFAVGFESLHFGLTLKNDDDMVAGIALPENMFPGLVADLVRFGDEFFPDYSLWSFIHTVILRVVQPDVELCCSYQ